MTTGEPYHGKNEAMSQIPDKGDTTSGAGAMVKSAADTAKQTASQAKQQAQPAMDQAKDTAVQVKNQVQQQATSTLSGRKDQAAQGLDSVAQAAGALSANLRNNNQEPLAKYTDQAGQQVHRLAQYLHERDVNELVGDAEQLARRQPALFLAGAFTLGVLAARFLKSSSQSASQSTPSNSRSWT